MGVVCAGVGVPAMGVTDARCGWAAGGTCGDSGEIKRVHATCTRICLVLYTMGYSI